MSHEDEAAEDGGDDLATRAWAHVAHVAARTVPAAATAVPGTGNEEAMTALDLDRLWPALHRLWGF